MNNQSALAKEARNAYQREWNRKNKEKLKLYSERYWAKKAIEHKDPEGCKHCGKPFEKRRTNHLYCSNNCRVNYSRRNIECDPKEKR